MKFLLDFFPILLFFIAYKLYGLYTATAVAISASFCQVGLHWYQHRRFDAMHLITLAIICVLGGATLFFQNELFIKWKPTVVYWVFAGIFFGTGLAGKKTLIERMMDSKVKLPQKAWRRLNASWMIFFTLLGGLNLYVVYHYSTDTWVNFKLFGMVGLTILFAILQAFYMSHCLEASLDECADE